MKKHNCNNIDHEMLTFESMYKTTIQVNNATKILKKFTVIINNKNRSKHLIENTQFFVSSFINKIDTFIFSMTKSTFKTENVD